MQLDARSVKGMLIDDETGRPLRWARWADLATGEYERFKADPEVAKRLGIPLESLLIRGRTRLRFVPAAPLAKPKPGGAPLDELRREVRRGRPIIAVPGRECDEPLCHRLAEYEVAAFTEVDPCRGEDGLLHERGVVTRLSKWCPWHFRPPVRTSLRGVEGEVEVATRPQ